MAVSDRKLRGGDRAAARSRRGSGYSGFLSSAANLVLPVGSRLRPGEVAGYFIDFSLKARAPQWEDGWRAVRASDQHYVVAAQWGLGCYERYLEGEGDAWLAAALDAAEYLLGEQQRRGPNRGGWVHHRPMTHTFRIEPPWLSAMAQGEAASLFVRVYRATREERFAEAARDALLPLGRWRADRGLRVELGDGFFLEEFPTDPPSLVLNGGIYALWGYYDVGIAFGDGGAMAEFELGADTLAANVGRWDTGSWSRYDLFPRRLVNVASPAYHRLHINQLRAMSLIAPRPELEAAASRFERYWASRRRRAAAFARKAAFRLLIPRHPLLAQRTPFGRPRQR